MLRLAIIGCGEVTRDLHAPAIRLLHRRGILRVEALIDPSSERAERMRRDFPRASMFRDTQEAFAASSPDLTLVASPAGLHSEHVRHAMNAGSHVLVEKPMVTSPAAANELVDAATAARRVLAVGLPRRLFPAVAELAAIVRRGELGDNVEFVYREGAPYDWKVATDTPFRRSASGGGVLLDKGAHALDTLQYIFGTGSVESASDDSLDGGVEANAVVRLSCERGRGTVQLSWDQALNNGFWIRGSRAAVRMNLGDISSFERRDGGGAWRRIRPDVSWPADVRLRNGRRLTPRGYHDCLYLQWVAFARAVLHGENPVVGAESARDVIVTIATAYAHAGPMEMPWLAAEEQEAQLRRHWRTEA